MQHQLYNGVWTLFESIFNDALNLNVLNHFFFTLSKMNYIQKQKDE